MNYSFTSNPPVASFESDRRRFLGDDEYGTWANPLALHTDELSDTEAQRGDNIGALLHHLGVLQPGETRRLITQLGQAESVAAALPSIQAYRDEKKVDQALQQMADGWADTLSKQRVETPGADLNRMVNLSIKLSKPGFDGFDPAKGGITSDPPGAKENGGIFVHTNPWAMIAETIMGDGDRAYEYYAQINPAAKNDRIEEYECEPYVYPQNILGDEHPQFGLARNSWLTGAASWVYQAATKYILGMRPTYTGLMIDPCLPRAWDGFKMTRRFRNACYAIEVENPDHVCRGVKALVVDGACIEGGVAPIFDDGRTHQLRVVLGD